MFTNHKPAASTQSSTSTLAPANSPTDTSNLEKQPPQDDSKPPNGGLKAYLQVLAAFMFFLNSWGLINTFGVFQTFYHTNLLRGVSNSDIAWIGALRAFILLGSPIFYGPLFDMGHVKALASYGTFMVAFGIMMTSLSREYYQFILAQGICVGLGSGALFLTAIAIVPTYFTTKKAAMMGIAASGSSIGGVIYPIVFRELEPSIGFSWAVRTIGFITLGTNLVAVIVLKGRGKAKERRALFSAALFRDKAFDIWSLAWFFGNMGLYIPYFFVQDYATSVVHMSMDTAFWTLTAINAASVFGRIVPGLIADAIDDPILVITVFTSATTILLFCWIAIRASVAGLFVFCVLYGFASGAFVSLSTPATVKLAPTMHGLGTRLGIFNGIGSLGLLVGNPVAGAIVEKSWTGAQIFAATACVLSLALLVSVIVYVRRKTPRAG